MSAVALASADAASASTDSEASKASSWVKLAFGVLLIIAALREWRARPADGEETTMPKWMKGIDAFTAPKALGLAALLGALNPKNPC